MKKILIFIIFVLFTVGCSNISTQNLNVTEEDRNSLLTMVTTIKEEFKNGEFETFEKALAPSIKNSVVRKNIETIDFSEVSILTSKPVFNKNTAKNMVAFIYGSNTLYLDVEYLLKNGEWKIVNFKERRG